MKGSLAVQVAGPDIGTGRDGGFHRPGIAIQDNVTKGGVAYAAGGRIRTGRRTERNSYPVGASVELLAAPVSATFLCDARSRRNHQNGRKGQAPKSTSHI